MPRAHYQGRHAGRRSTRPRWRQAAAGLAGLTVSTGVGISGGGAAFITPVVLALFLIWFRPLVVRVEHQGQNPHARVLQIAFQSGDTADREAITTIAAS